MATLFPEGAGPSSPKRERLSHIEDRMSFSLFERLSVSSDSTSLGRSFSLEPGEDPLKEHEYVMTVGIGSPIQLGTLCITSSRLLLLVKSASVVQLRKWFEEYSTPPKPRPTLHVANSFTFKRPSFTRRGSLRNKHTHGVSQSMGQWRSEENITTKQPLCVSPEPLGLSGSLSDGDSLNGDREQNLSQINVISLDNGRTSPDNPPISPLSPSKIMAIPKKALTMLRKGKSSTLDSKSTFYCPIDLNSVKLEDLPSAKPNSIKSSTVKTKKRGTSKSQVNDDVTLSPVKTMDSWVRMREQSPKKSFPGSEQQKPKSYFEPGSISHSQSKMQAAHLRSESFNVIYPVSLLDKDEVQSLPEFRGVHSLTTSPTLLAEEKESHKKSFSFDLASAQQVSIPFGIISRVERLFRFDKTPLPSPLDGFRIVCKNCQTLTILVHPKALSDLEAIITSIEFFLNFSSPKSLYEFAQTHRKSLKIPDQFLPEENTGAYQLEREATRLGLKKTQVWRVFEVDTHKHYATLPVSYPPRVVVPLSFTDADLLKLAPNYRESRFPTLCWRHPGNRAALLRASALVKKKERTQVIGDFLAAVCQASSRQGDKLLILCERDSSEISEGAQPSQTSQERMQAYLYPGCVLECSFSPTPIPKLRQLLSRLQALLNTEASGEYLTQLQGTRWMREISKLLQTARLVASQLEQEHMSVLVSFESGSDFTTQVVSLAQLLLDPYYRTMDGFQVLVQKEWISMGHKFQHRHLPTGDHSKEESCVFLQFVECVWQIMQQFPSVFEFNEKFLHFLLLHSYSGQYGDFLANNLEEYYALELDTKTMSLFTWLHYHNLESNRFYNPAYHLPPANQTSHTFQCLLPEYCLPAIRSWTSYYAKYSATSHSDSASSLGLLNTVQLLNAKITELRQKENELKLQLSYPSLGPLPDQEEGAFCSREKQARALSFGLKNRTSLKRGTLLSGLEESEPTNFFSQLPQEVIADVRASKLMSVSMSVCSGYLYRQNNPVIGLSKRLWGVCDLNKNYFALFHTPEAHQKQEVPKHIYKLSSIEKVQLFNGSNPSSSSFSFVSNGKAERFHCSSKNCFEIWFHCLSIRSLQ